jgi:hypothetical protein
MLCHKEAERTEDEQRGYCLGFTLCRLPLWLLWLRLHLRRHAVAITAATAACGISLLFPLLVFLIRFMSREIK